MSDVRKKLSDMDKTAMLAHVKELATKNNILLRLEAPNNGQCKAYRKAKPQRVVTRPITSQRTYITALHELGHCLSMDSQKAGDEGKQLLCEAEAWAWAIKTSRVELNNPTRHDLGKALKSYNDKWEQKAKESGGNLQVVYPPEEHIYWEIIGWAAPPAKKERVLP